VPDRIFGNSAAGISLQLDDQTIDLFQEGIGNSFGFGIHHFTHD
jgi:hypothetical protein